MSAVEGDLHAGEIDALRANGLHGMLHVALDGIGDFLDGAHGIARRTVGIHRAGFDCRLNFVLDLVGELEALTVEQLDAVVLGRIVACADHDAAITLELLGQKGDGRSRDDAREQRGAAHARDACAHGGFQHIAGKARGLAHDDAGPLEAHGRLAEAEGERTGEFDVGDAPDAVGSKHTCHVMTFRLSCN